MAKSHGFGNPRTICIILRHQQAIPGSLVRQCLITGANRGLGLALSRELLQRGARVLACCRDPEAATELTALAAEHADRLQIEPLDVTDDAAVAALSQRLGRHLRRLDLLVHNAGILVSGERFGNVRSDDLARSFAVNASAPLLLTQALAGLLQHGHQPRVLCISSQLGSITQSNAFRTVSYAMSKAAMNMAVKRLDGELCQHGITVMAMHPGWLKTRMGGDSATLDPATSARMILDQIARTTPEDGGKFLAYDGTTLPW